MSSGTLEKYANHNVDLILWIYEKDEWSEELLRDWMVEPLINDEDKGNKDMRATYKAALKSINKNDDNCSILLEKIIFNLFSHYMSIKKVR